MLGQAVYAIENAAYYEELPHFAVVQGQVPDELGPETLLVNLRWKVTASNFVSHGASPGMDILPQCLEYDSNWCMCF